MAKITPFEVETLKKNINNLLRKLKRDFPSRDVYGECDGLWDYIDSEATYYENKTILIQEIESRGYWQSDKVEAKKEMYKIQKLLSVSKSMFEQQIAYLEDKIRQFEYIQYYYDKGYRKIKDIEHKVESYHVDSGLFDIRISRQDRFAHYKKNEPKFKTKLVPLHRFRPVVKW
jgi:hypothetical protein